MVNENTETLILEILNNSRECGISSNEVNFVKNLVLNKCDDESLFVCEGLWAAEKLIQKNIPVTHFFYNAEALKNHKFSDEILQKITKLCKYSSKSYGISEKSCKKISDRDGFDQFFIVAKQEKLTLSDLEIKLKNNDNVLGIVMDGLEQPGNIGAILRSFDAAGGNFAIITNRQAKLSNSRLVRSSLGASFMLPVLEAEIEDVQKWLQKENYKCIVTDLQGKLSYRDADYSGKVVIVAGNEHTGISDSWRKLKNSTSVIIPMYGSVESLNVGFASTLVAYEAGITKFGKKIN